MWRYSISLACIRIESTDGNFGTREKVAIPIPIVTCTLPIPIPIFGIFVFPFPWDSHGNPMGIPFPCTSLLCALLLEKRALRPWPERGRGVDVAITNTCTKYVRIRRRLHRDTYFVDYLVCLLQFSTERLRRPAANRSRRPNWHVAVWKLVSTFGLNRLSASHMPTETLGLELPSTVHLLLTVYSPSCSNLYIVNMDLSNKNLV